MAQQLTLRTPTLLQQKYIYSQYKCYKSDLHFTPAKRLKSIQLSYSVCKQTGTSKARGFSFFEIWSHHQNEYWFSIFVYGRKFKLAMSRQTAVECSEHHQHGSEPSRGSLTTGLNVPFSPWSHFCHEHACRADDGGNHGDTQEPSDGSSGDGHGAAEGGVDMAAVMGLIGSLTDR